LAGYLCIRIQNICNISWLFIIHSLFIFFSLVQVKVPEAGDSVEYVSQTAAVVTPVKRGKKLKADVPMEERLDNLSLARQETASHKPPQVDSMAHLLMQVCMPWQMLCKDHYILL
jgi:hypothetical protein